MQCGLLMELRDSMTRNKLPDGINQIQLKEKVSKFCSKDNYKILSDKTL